MKDLIFEALVAEAQFRVAEHAIRGVAVDEAINEVAREMELETPEVQELTTRVKKAPTPKPVREEEEDGMEEIIHDEPSTAANALEFNTPEELETAVGVLMYKGIAWATKEGTTIAFQNADDVKKAKEALNRRWEFINSEPRVVATIDFDNLEDYAKVLDFIQSKRMAVIQTQADLDADLDMQIEEAAAQFKQAKKEAKAAGHPAPEEPTSEMSFKALHKDSLIDASALDVLADEKARALHVVKRWK